MNKLEKINIFIPIERAIEHEGKRYVYGYACIFDSPDAHGTIISQKVVKDSIPRLQKYPSIRFMHRTPLGQIVFDKEIKGIRTHVDQHGFHVLGQVYDACEKEWNMIKEGQFGFSYGMKLAENGIQKQQIGNKYYDVFVNGLLYEISVVDSPSHSESHLNTIERSLTFMGNNDLKLRKKIREMIAPIRRLLLSMCEQPKQFTMIGSDVYEIAHVNGKIQLRMFHEKEEKIKIPEPISNAEILIRNMEEDWRSKEFPEICSEQCPHKTCGYHNPKHYGQPCEMRFESKKNEPDMKARMPVQTENTHCWTNPEMKKSLRG